jgi:hypothetical protein
MIARKYVRTTGLQGDPIMLRRPVFFAAFAMLFVFSCMLMTAVGAAPVSVAQDANDCTIPFTATVRQGPDEGLVLSGDLHLTWDATGAAMGELTTADATLMVGGQITGRAVNLIIQQGEDGWIFGVGTALNTFDQDCGGVLGGPFSGPAEGDLGDWIGCGVKVKNSKLAPKPAEGSLC